MVLIEWSGMQMLSGIRARTCAIFATGAFVLSTVLGVAAGEAKIQPGTVIQFNAQTAACLSREALLEYKALTVKGDNKKIRALFFEFGGHSCVLLGPGKKFKVISADYNPGSPIGILEIIGIDALGNAGSWVFSDGAVPVAR